MWIFVFCTISFWIISYPADVYKGLLLQEYENPLSCFTVICVFVVQCPCILPFFGALKANAQRVS